MKKILLFLFLLLSFLPIGVDAASFMDKIAQPHLAVVDYNETLESIKNNILTPVSIFSDDDLRKKWANTIVSLGVIIIFVFLIKIGISIAQGSKNNLKKDAAYLLLLFFIASIFTPLFSNISELTAGGEDNYTDETTKEEYSRIYLPANTAVVVNPTYRDEKGNLKTYNEYLAKRNTVYNESGNYFSDDYLGVPAKIVQTQVESKNNPIQRSATAFYGVNVDVLFSNLIWPIKSFPVKECHIDLQKLVTKGPGSPLTFVEALGREGWTQQYKINQENAKDNTKELISKVDGTEIDNGEGGVVIKVENCTLGEYFLSNEFIESYSHGLGRNGSFSGPEEVIKTIKENWNRDYIQSTLRDAGVEVSYFSEDISNIWGGLTYEQQKRVVYTLEAYRNLYILSLSQNTKMKDDVNVKDAMLACGRILLDKVQGNGDFKTCLATDVFGDTTLYTQETSKNIGLLGRNTDINSGYVFPVPQGQDWDQPAYYRVGRDLTSFLKVQNYTDDKRSLWEKIKAGTSTSLSTLWESSADFLTSLLESDPEAKKKIEYGTLQGRALETSGLFTRQTFSPQLASFNSYDLSGNGVIDREEFAVSGKQNLSPTFYAYYYSGLEENKTITLGDKSLNFLQTPIYDTIPVETDGNKKFISFGVVEDTAVVESVSSSSMPVSQIGNQKYIIYKDEPNKSISSMTLRAGDYISGGGTTVKEWVTYDPQNLTKKSLDVIYKENKDYAYFTSPELTSLFYKDRELTQSDTLGVSLTDIGFFVGNEESYGNGEYFIRNGAGFDHCPSKQAIQNYYNGDGSGCSYKTEVDGVNFNTYRSQKITEGKQILKIFEQERNVTFGGTSTITKIQLLELEIPLSKVTDYKFLYLGPGASSYAPSTPIYTYQNIKSGQLVSFNSGDHYLQANRILVGNVTPTKIGDVSIVSSGTATVASNEGKIGRVEDIFIEMVDFNKLGKKYPNTFTRLLLNPKYNPPLTYLPKNDFYYPEYQKIEGKCLLNPDLSIENKDLFDTYPGKDKNFLDKCSMVGEHVRLTDIRLNTYVQEESLLNIGPEGESFTHVDIPLLLNEEIPDFSKDRRSQSYAGEAKNGDSLIGSKLIEGIKIREGDIAVLKPGVMLGSYNIPYTFLVSSDILPFLSFVKTDNPTIEKQRSIIYSGGIYSVMTDLVSYLRNGEIAQSIFGSASPQTESEKYTNYLKDIYDSRPESLKKIEGVVPDRYFTAHYGSAYYTSSDAKTGSSIIASIGEFGLGILDAILEYRVKILETVFVLGPLLVFCLLFTATRKIFTFTLTITIVLLLLPIIILLLVNIFS